MDFTWILGKLGSGYAIGLNPSPTIGIDLEAQDLVQIAGLARPNRFPAARGSDASPPRP